MHLRAGLPERLEVEPVDSVLAMAAQAMGEDPGTRSIILIARNGLQVPITSFFDDCTPMTRESGAESTNFAVTGLFKLLGVHYAREVPSFCCCLFLYWGGGGFEPLSLEGVSSNGFYST